MRPSSLLVLALVLMGCGGNVCEPRLGTYLYRYAQRAGGTCSAFNSEDWPTPQVAAMACADNSKYSADSCGVSVDVTCPSYTMKGQLDWNWSGTTASGTVQVDAVGAKGATCSGTYDVEAGRVKTGSGEVRLGFLGTISF